MSKESKLKLQFHTANHVDCLLTVRYKKGFIHSGSYDGLFIYRAEAENGQILGYSTTEQTARKRIRNFEKGDL